MRLEDLVQRAGAWLSATPEPGVVVSTRVRLARNLRDAAFPGWAGKEECRRLRGVLFDAIRRVPGLDDALALDLGALDPLDRLILQERHLISADLARRQGGSGLVVSSDERVAIMINEEDHLRMQAFLPGFGLRAAWERIDAIDTALERVVPFAFDPVLGYLTACPTNVGTGLRASVMLHLPALRLAGDLEPVLKGLSKIGVAVRGSFGEGTEAWGNLLQISNQRTLGEAEEGILERMEALVTEVVEHELHARTRLREDPRPRLADFVGRAVGVIRHAHLLTSREALDVLSALRLGLDLGLVRAVDAGQIGRLMLLTQPGHLQRILQRSARADDRDTERARLVRTHLADVTVLKEPE